MAKRLLANIFSKGEAIRGLELIHACTQCRNEQDVRRLMSSMQVLLPHEHAVCGFANMTPNDHIGSYGFINVSYPAEYLERQILNMSPEADPAVRAHFSKFSIQHFEDILPGCDHDYISLCKDLGIYGKGYIHGARNYSGKFASMFIYAGKSVKRSAQSETILELLTPHLHEAVMRAMHHVAGPQIPPNTLMPREREALKWLSEGKTTWEISTILGISARTVKYHIENAMHKLDASTRAHAVAITIQNGMVDIE